MEDVRFFYQQANRCYQLAWQSFICGWRKGSTYWATSIQRRRASCVRRTAERQTKKPVIREDSIGDCLSPGATPGFFFLARESRRQTVISTGRCGRDCRACECRLPTVITTTVGRPRRAAEMAAGAG